MGGIGRAFKLAFPDLFTEESILNTYEEFLAPYKDKCILGLASAARAHRLTEEGFYAEEITVYSTEELDDPNFECRVEPDCFEELEYMELHGFYITTKEQTILDLLNIYGSFENSGIYFCLLKYYLDNGNSFNGLESRMNTWQLKAFNHYVDRVKNPNIPIILERVQPYWRICRVCMESAAEFWGLTDGSLFTKDSKIKVYSEEQIEDPYIEVVPYPDGKRRKASSAFLDIDFVDAGATVSDLLSQDIDFEDPAYFSILVNYALYDAYYGLRGCLKRNHLKGVSKKLDKLEPKVVKYIAENYIMTSSITDEERLSNHKDLNLEHYELGFNKDKCIVSNLSAASFHGLQTETVIYGKLEVYTEKKFKQKESSDFKQIVRPNCFETVDYIDCEGFHITSEEQTLVDLIDGSDRHPKELVYVSLLTYYFRNNASFGSLESKLSESQQKIFSYYKDRITNPCVVEILNKVKPYKDICQIALESAIEVWGLSDGKFYAKDNKVKVYACQKIEDPNIEVVDYYLRYGTKAFTVDGIEVVTVEKSLKNFLYNRTATYRDALVTSFANYRLWESFSYQGSFYNPFNFLTKRPLTAFNRWMEKADQHLAEQGIVIPEDKKRKRIVFKGQLGLEGHGGGTTILMADRKEW